MQDIDILSYNNHHHILYILLMFFQYSYLFQYFKQSFTSYSTRCTFSTAFITSELQEELCKVNHTRIFVNNNHFYMSCCTAHSVSLPAEGCVIAEDDTFIGFAVKTVCVVVTEERCNNVSLFNPGLILTCVALKRL